MRLQLEILLHPAARWGEDASLLVAAGAAAFLLKDCLRGVGTPGSSRIMVLGRQWPLLPLPPPCHTPPPLLLPPPTVPPAATATIATPQIDLSDSDSNSSSDSRSADDDSGSCVIVESVAVGNKGKTSFVCLSGDVRRVMLDKVKVNASKGNVLQSREQGTQVLWGCTECHCRRLTQPETGVSAKEANVVVNSPVTAVDM